MQELKGPSPGQGIRRLCRHVQNREYDVLGELLKAPSRGDELITCLHRTTMPSADINGPMPIRELLNILGTVFERQLAAKNAGPSLSRHLAFRLLAEESLQVSTLMCPTFFCVVLVRRQRFLSTKVPKIHVDVRNRKNTHSQRKQTGCASQESLFVFVSLCFLNADSKSYVILIECLFSNIRFYGVSG